jgi:hypothetical protein
MAPLYSLLQKMTPWSWGLQQQAAISAAKRQLTSSTLFVHYSSQRSLLPACVPHSMAWVHALAPNGGRL